MRVLNAAGLTILVQALAIADAPLTLGAQRELLVDRQLIDTLDGAALRMHAPVPAGTVLRFDAPWEGRYAGYVTVFQDGAKLRMYYRGLPTDGKDGSNAETTCYAESSGGVSWVKPKLGIFEVHGTRENNVVLAGQAPFSHNFAPFLDTRPDVPGDEKYKAVAGTSESGLWVFNSPDGLRWRKVGEKPIITAGAFDSQNVAFWSESERQYICYFRTWSKGGYEGFRTVSRATSADFVAWSAPVAMDFGGTPMEHLYTNQTLPYFRAPQLYIAIAARFMPGRRVVDAAEANALGIEGGYAGDCSDAVLMSSRGGNRYDRTFMESYIRPGIGAENWTSRTNYPARGIVQTGPGEMSIFVQAAYGQPAAHLVRHTLRLDGFASLNAPYAGGTMTTKPFTFSGGALHVNFATSAAGGIHFELRDAAGVPLPGHALAECGELIGNEIDRTVRWNGTPDLSAWAGRPVRLHAALKDADLYSFAFE